MNFATVELHQYQDQFSVRLGGHDLVVSGAHRAALARYMGSPVVIGLRPAAFSLATTPGETALTIVPLGVESLGDEKHVLFTAPPAGNDETAPDLPDDGPDAVPVTVDDSAGTQLWTAKVTQRADLAIGRPMSLAVDLSAAYFFDPVSGEAVAGAPGTAATDVLAVGAAR